MTRRAFAFTFVLTACSSNPAQQSGSEDRTWPSLSMWEVSARRGAFQVNAQYEDVKIVVTKIENEAGAVLYDFKEKGALSRFKDMFSEHRRFPPGSYRVEANCVRNAVDITSADNPNYILDSFRLTIDLEPNVIVDLVPSPTGPHTINGYMAQLGCKLNPTGLNRLTSEKTVVRFRSE